MHNFLTTSMAAIALTLPAVAAAQQAAPPTAPAPAPAPQTGYGAWFGSVPDMEGSSGGILLSGTSVGSPAEKAGLKAGDFITIMGGRKVPDLTAMVTILRSHKAGDTLEVVYFRGNSERKAKVVLGVRPGG